ncbi:hypothetical protein V6N13_129417 [Hibiscus sabdariffa]|uniref:Uncharacterized protein n=1 Tax=Hibiscus sabdariffa TaxID=183260 RepID=A0ABR2SL56_9ROSI
MPPPSTNIIASEQGSYVPTPLGYQLRDQIQHPGYAPPTGHFLARPLYGDWTSRWHLPLRAVVCPLAEAPEGSSLTQPQMMILSDPDDIFAPLPNDLLVNLSESRNVVGTFLV